MRSRYIICAVTAHRVVAPHNLSIRSDPLTSRPRCSATACLKGHRRLHSSTTQCDRPRSRGRGRLAPQCGAGVSRHECPACSGVTADAAARVRSQAVQYRAVWRWTRAWSRGSERVRLAATTDPSIRPASAARFHDRPGRFSFPRTW
jgi:hypothetical protein